ncbi:protein-glutamine gamma-glutamyltransferase E-like [Styela clava]
MGGNPSKPKKPMTAEKVLGIMEEYPQYVQQYYKQNEDEIEEYIVENFWEEDVARWLNKIRNRSPKENLQVRKIDFLKIRNTSTHHTSSYENKSLVIRRAADFTVDVIFGNRSFDPERDDISIIFSIGAQASQANKSKMTCFASDKPGKKEKWYCVLESVDSETKKVTLKVHVPATAIIGSYKVSLDIVSGTKAGRVKSTHNDANIIVLFNPYSKDDVVYMENEAWRKEYVQEDNGFINTGTYTRGTTGKKKWDFAQFDQGVLDSVLLMIQKDSRVQAQPIKSLKKCNSPVFLSRVLAAMVNSNDDSGVLTGRWTGKYDDGRNPSDWSDSAKIISEWRDNDYKAVKYGQCWVFSGLLTTAMRAIGIPARSVTNFKSAHDTDMNQTVDIYLDSKTYEKIDHTSDSIWNFHVWNEAYFARPDLQGDYGGWQVVDATPQEESAILDPSGDNSKGLMQCGPAPVKAVKEGDINIGSDTGFVFSEVNADKVYWFVDKWGNVTRPPIVMTRAVGVYIGTKAVGKYQTENIISQYKYPEGSAEERKAFHKAYGMGTREHQGFETDYEIVPQAFEITIQELENAIVGQDITTKVSVKNVSGKKQQANIKIAEKSMKNVGKSYAALGEYTKDFELGSGKDMSFTFTLKKDDYIQHLVDDYSININVTVVSSLDGNTSIAELDATLGLPDCVTIKMPESFHWLDEVEVEAVIKNLLPMPLSKGSLTVEGRGIDISSNYAEVGKPLQPGESFTTKAKLKARYGWRRVYGEVIFRSAEVRLLKENYRTKVTT